MSQVCVCAQAVAEAELGADLYVAISKKDRAGVGPA